MAGPTFPTRLVPLDSLDDSDWNTIVSRIRTGRCTPFVGAGMSAHRLPAGAALARALADDYRYPFADRENLARVAQFAAVEKNDGQAVKELVADRFSDATRSTTAASFSAADDPHRILADLPFERYLTTNYDRFIEEALLASGASYEADVCPWNQLTRNGMERWRRLHGAPSAAAAGGRQPLVYHLHGELNLPESMVLTDDDYLDFLAEIVLDPSCIRPEVSSAFAESSVLFLGYSLTDVTFRVIFRIALQQLKLNQQRAHFAVQLPPRGNSDAEAAAIKQYLEKYLGRDMKVRFFWGTAQEFMRALRERWDARFAAGAAAGVPASAAPGAGAP